MSQRTSDAAVTVARVPVLWCVMMRLSPDRSKDTPSRSIRCGCMLGFWACFFSGVQLIRLIANRFHLAISHAQTARMALHLLPCRQTAEQQTESPDARGSRHLKPDEVAMHQEQKAGSRVGWPGGLANQCAYIVRIVLPERPRRTGSFSKVADSPERRAPFERLRMGVSSTSTKERSGCKSLVLSIQPTPNCPQPQPLFLTLHIATSTRHLHE